MRGLRIAGLALRRLDKTVGASGFAATSETTSPYGWTFTQVGSGSKLVIPGAMAAVALPRFF